MRYNSVIPNPLSPIIFVGLFLSATSSQGQSRCGRIGKDALIIPLRLWFGGHFVVIQDNPAVMFRHFDGYGIAICRIVQIFENMVIAAASPNIVAAVARNDHIADLSRGSCLG